MAATLTVGLLCFVATVITVLPPMADSSPISLEDGRPNARRVYWALNQEDESSEDGAQTYGGEQKEAGDSSEEVGGGGWGPDPPVRPPVEPSQGPGTSNPNPGPETPDGGGPVTQAPSPSMAPPQPATMPPVTAPTTPPRGDGGTGIGSFAPRQAVERAPNVLPLPNPPKINNNIAAISKEVEVPTNRNRVRVPLGALLTVVVIGGLVVVMAVGGVAYFFATRVRIH
ncbi:proline-rich receptor-like protein kinase PERK9 [Patiria miniata]|uniref:Uncharacterized protein n=1 Tax=Patiria miniata TaxID=46514 RepID=A0A914B6S2_PATMI|nr:proline-rich receptor-like protein kinase PERK9 [Patiria miniata]